jgi:predicted amidohydrolase
VNDFFPTFLAAAIQFEPTLFEKTANTDRLLALTEEAARNGARLIVLPEMATTSYCWGSRGEIASDVEPIPGPTTDRFAALAARHDCYVVVGLPEVAPATGIFYNSAALVGPDGVVGVYRKVHSYLAEPKWAKDGDLGFPVFETPLGRIAIVICMDACFPESTRIPALRGADVICFPTNWLGGKCPSATWIARAFESGVYLVAANRYGLERTVQFSGGSCVVDPDGTVLASRDTGDGIVYAEIEPARSRDKRRGPGRAEDKLADRRPDAYGTLTLNTYRWRDWDFHGLYGLRPLPVGRRGLVAVSQFGPVAGHPEANLARIARAAAEQATADLLVVPELAVSGPVADRATAERVAEPIPGPATERLRRIAAAQSLHIVAGLVERDGDGLFNSAVVVGPDGVAGIYRKLHLDALDRRWATPGDRGLPTFDLPLCRLGVLIGYDAHFPEASRCLALDGADLIACPSLLDAPAVQAAGPTAVPLPPEVERGPTADHFHLWRERALENSTYVAFANGAAPAMGWSAIFGPDTEDDADDQALVPGAGEGGAALSIDTTNLETHYATNIVRAKDYLGWRMPIWYDPLQAPTGATVDETPVATRSRGLVPVAD